MIKDRIQIRNEFLDNLQNELSKMEGTYNFDIAATTGLTVEKLYELLDYWSKQTFIDTATEDDFVDKHAILFGVTRRLGTKARGEITITGKANTNVVAGTIVLNRAGIKYKTLHDSLITQHGKVKIPIECSIGGIQGNCVAGEINSFEIADTNIYTVTNEESITGGYDKEPNNSLIARAKERVTRPAHSGNVNDYIQWARQVEGVGKVKVKPLWNGNGTVKILIANYNNDFADSELVRRVKERLERDDGRPVGAQITVESFRERTISVVVDIVLEVGTEKVDVEDKIKAAINVAIKQNNCTYTKNNREILSINRLEREVLNIEGIADAKIKINTSGENIEIADDEMLKVTEVTVNER